MVGGFDGASPSAGFRCRAMGDLALFPPGHRTHPALGASKPVALLGTWLDQRCDVPLTGPGITVLDELDTAEDVPPSRARFFAGTAAAVAVLVLMSRGWSSLWHWQPIAAVVGENWAAAAAEDRPQKKKTTALRLL